MLDIKRLIKSSLHFKMLAATSLTVTVALISSFIILIVIELYIDYSQAENELTIVGKAVSSNIHSSLVFDDQKFANQAMKIFKIEDNIQYAQLFRKDGSLFSQYHQDIITTTTATYIQGQEGLSRQGLSLIYREKLYLDKNLIGTLFISYELFYLLLWVFYKAIILLFIFIISAALAFNVWSKLHPPITQPIFLLLDFMDRITSNHDYSLQVPKQTEDELGLLIDGFNEMLMQIRNRDQLLENHTKQLELRIEERTHDLMQEKLKAENANRYKSEFLATMSHEIRTPLNGVIGLTQLLSRQGLTTEQNEIVDKLSISAKVLLQLINNVLDLAKIEAGKLNLDNTNFNLKNILNETITTFENPASEKGLKLLSDLDSSIPEHLLGDSNRISQILINLISNAIKFTDSGTITIKVEIRKNTEIEVLLLLSVIDTGIGVTQQQQENIFTHFTQADNSISRQYGGTGLGLSICKHLVELMGGKISIQSSLGKGCTFNCLIPIAKQLTAEIAAKSNNTNTSHHGLQILVVDDEEINRYLTKGLLETENIQVTLAENGETAIQLAEKQEFNVVLMDLHMPNLNGWDTTRLFRASPLAQLSHVPIIGVTADVLKESRDLCIDAGMNLVISKPFQLTELLEQIHTLLEKSE
jgi:two-component system, sensor histidine kinase